MSELNMSDMDDAAPNEGLHISTEIDPNDNIHIISGNGVLSFEDFKRLVTSMAGNHDERLARYSHLERHERLIETRITNPERDAWNARVDVQKAAKRARKAAK